MRGRWEVNNKQWAALEPILSSPRRNDSHERAPYDTRAVLNAVLWVLGTGAEWQELPRKYPPHQTCHRHLQQWVKTGQLEEALRALACSLQQQGKLCVEEVLPGYDPGAKGLLGTRRAGRRKAAQIFPISFADGISLAAWFESFDPRGS